jgi:hypothetical protein
MMVGKAAVGKREKEEEGGRKSGKVRVADQTAGITERAFTPLSVGKRRGWKRDKTIRFKTVRISSWLTMER